MRGQIRMEMGLTEWTLLLVLGTLWGGAYFFGKVALAELPPFTVAACRVGLAAMVLTWWPGRPAISCRSRSRPGGRSS